MHLAWLLIWPMKSSATPNKTGAKRANARPLDASRLQDNHMVNDENPQAPVTRMDMCRAFSAKIKADNEKERDARNSRRWKAERDPAEYAAQKDRQREQYALGKSGTVRSYEKIKAATVTERDEIRKGRDASRKKDRYANQSPEERQAESDKKAERQFVKRRREKNMAEDLIQAELVAYIHAREAKRAKAKAELAEEDMMRENPIFGMF